jgi:hypothetical protein
MAMEFGTQPLKPVLQALQAMQPAVKDLNLA